ncbi:uncharacterized protein LOC124909719 [Impatiens glandulifera]|uniref:uncharacterized protein LOC124909719 n=1 Tax=Impatiens glandulifera TaxID=253017 RepID=UPI001FB101F6|nr:uncharacterized protein LOC124909719 [Impatiens glandulifera]
MGNLPSSFLSGFGQALSDLFGSPLDFLSGKSCSSVCGTTWDFICYIENFCISHLVKLAVVSVLVYLEYSCTSICHSLHRVKRVRRRRRRHMRDIESRDSTSEDEEEMEERGSSDLDRRKSLSRRDWKGYKRDRFRRSLGVSNHRIRVGIDGDSSRRKRRYHTGYSYDDDNCVRVSRTSKFARKGGIRKCRSISRNE